MAIEHKVTGYCEKCEEFGTVYFDFSFDKFHCKNCGKVESYNFTLMELKNIEDFLESIREKK